MEEWEYWTGFLEATIRKQGVQDYLYRTHPNWKAPEYTPEAMIPELNQFGKTGWELVHMQPVVVGRNQDVGFPHGGDVSLTQWTNLHSGLIRISAFSNGVS
jgi:hypothetical protein